MSYAVRIFTHAVSMVFRDFSATVRATYAGLLLIALGSALLIAVAPGLASGVTTFDNPEVIAAYNAAKKKGIYEKVLLFTGAKVKHYGLSNHKEYFAEMTEAYFGVNDFYPFVRAELKEYDPQMYGLMQKFWGRVR